MNGDTMTRAELIETLTAMIEKAGNSEHPMLFGYGMGLADALRLIKGEDIEGLVGNLFDIEEVHENCTVQVLRNSITGAVSVGWFPHIKE